MAISEEIVSTLSRKQLERFEELQELVAKAEETKDAPTPVADFVKAASKFSDAIPTSEDAKLALANALVTEAEVNKAVATLAKVRSLTEYLQGKQETVDRTRGDLVASALDVMAKGDALDDVAIPVANALVERWIATRPSGSNGSSGEAPADLGFRVWTKCQVQGCKWSSHTDKHNVNSCRHQAIVHAREDHSTEYSTRKGGKPEDFAELTEAITSVIESKATEATSPRTNFIISR